MGKSIFSLAIFILVGSIILSCQTLSKPVPSSERSGKIKVVAAETFLTDIAQNIAGDRLIVESLIPVGVDPHAFEPSPADVTKIAQADLLIVNGAGFEGWLHKVLENAGGTCRVIEASSSLFPRQREEVVLHETINGEKLPQKDGGHKDNLQGSDPHFWLNPILVIKYVENIRDGLSQVDESGSETYKRNAEKYISQLKELDDWIRSQINKIPPDRRLLVTNHESFGYFADRYGFQVVGTIIPSASSGASPSAQQLVNLVTIIQKTRSPAIFLETGSNPQLASQISQEAGVKLITDLYTHSVTLPNGNAPTYVEMMKYNTERIVEALK